MSSLSIYKASAGSGKTYQLTWNYLEMLFEDPFAYKKILAVTFTNMAAGEMKERILESLWMLSRGDEKTDHYRSELCRIYSLSEREVQQKAGQILGRILNDYSSFFVGTIDRFFQWIIRGFVREIGLQTGYNLELNTDLILQEAVDRIMFKMDEDDKLKEWLITFAEERMVKGKSWKNFQSDIFILGKEIFSESYRELYSALEDPSTVREKVGQYKKELFAAISSFENYLRSQAKEALKKMEDAGLSPDDFTYKKSGPAGYFLKVIEKEGLLLEPTKRALKAVDDTEFWVPKSCEDYDFRLKMAEDHLQPLLRKIVSYYEAHAQAYFTARVLIKNIYAFGILNDINEQIREITLDRNIFLLSDTTIFLKKIIAGNEAPFVYEKAGNYFSRFMLDEFQDTSRFQWDNFLPLIRNGLSEGAKSLVVGDVKQSIYRWRNSDWKILATELEKELQGFDPEIKPLDTNWRSYRNIVMFNNAFFDKATRLLADMIEDEKGKDEGLDEFIDGWKDLVRRVYADAAQAVPDKFMEKEGLVQFRFYRSDNGDDYSERIRKEIPRLIREMQDRHVKAREICILVRRKSEGKEIASMLFEESVKDDKYNFNVISNDSLFIAGHPSVRFLSAVLGFIINPYNRLNHSFLRNEYLNYLISGDSEDRDMHRVFAEDVENSLHSAFKTFNEELDHLKRLPLYELIEELISLFELNHEKDNLPYLQAFQNVVMEFIRTESADISSFLSYWEKNGHSHTLNVSETQDAIRIMTIHKAKGLQFPVVIIPFCNWAMGPETQGNKNNFIWCSTEDTSYNTVPFMPVSYGDEMAASSFAGEYYNEKFHSYIDSLNLLYVSFTRAVRELHVFSPLSRKNIGNGKAAGFSYNLINGNHPLSKDKPFLNLAEHFNPEEEVLLAGSPQTEEFPTQDLSNMFLEEYPVNINRDTLKLQVKNSFLSELEEDLEEKLGYGTIMHEIFSFIKTKDDAAGAVERLRMKGSIDRQEARALREKIEKELKREKVREWFDGKYRIRTECEMVSGSSELLRPDRVMKNEDEIIIVDYKFGNKILQQHEKQVEKYCRVLSAIEFKPVKGFLWYFDLGKIIEV